MAETTTILFAGSSSMSFAAFLMRSAEPTHVPPNLWRGRADNSLNDSIAASSCDCWSSPRRGRCASAL